MVVGLRRPHKLVPSPDPEILIHGSTLVCHNVRSRRFFLRLAVGVLVLDNTTSSFNDANNAAENKGRSIP
jgi:hypothetical protein